MQLKRLNVKSIWVQKLIMYAGVLVAAWFVLYGPQQRSKYLAAAQGAPGATVGAAGSVSIPHPDTDVDFRLRSVASTATGLVAAEQGQGFVRVASYDLKGAAQDTSAVDLDPQAKVRDVAVDGAGDVAVLTRGSDGESVTLASPSSRSTQVLAVSRKLESIALLKGQVFARSGSDLIRIADNAVVATLPTDAPRPFTMLTENEERILFLSKIAPKLYSVVPESGTVNEYSLDSPEIRAAINASAADPPITPQGRVLRDLIFAAAVGTDGYIYGLISPFRREQAEIVKFDEFGSVLGTFHIALSQTNSPGNLRRATAWNVVPSLIAVANQRFFLYSRPHNLLVYYELPAN